MADRIMRMPQQGFSNQPLGSTGTSIQRKCAACASEEEQIRRKPLMMKSEGGVPTASPALGSQLNNTKGGGSPMSNSTNSFMGNAFGTDFSHVRIHTGASAVQMNQDLNARAFTHGSDIYFNSGEYRPDSNEGKRLLGHELTHVVQQGAGMIRPKIQCEFSRQPRGGGSAVSTLTEQQLNDAVAVNVRRLRDPYMVIQVRDLLGLSQTSSNDTDLAAAIGRFQAYGVCLRPGRLAIVLILEYIEN